MGESVLNAPDVQNKMGGSVSPHGALEVSISFGRFENDSLSWEKWSTFSPNKYLEEVEKCSTPGSVAQKKAYFEAHYKKIAARKAELLEQENMMRTDSSRSNELNCADYSTSTSGTEAEHGTLNGQSLAEEVELDTNSLSEVSSSLVNESAEADVNGNGNALECQNSLVESADVELNEKLQFKEVNCPEKSDLIMDEILKISEEVQVIDEKPLKLDNDTVSMVEVQEGRSEFDAHNTDEKVPQTKREQNLALILKKKPVLPTTKSTGISTPTNPRLPKSMSTSTPRSSKTVSASTPRSSKPVSASTTRLSKPVPTSTPRLSKPVPTSTPRSFKPVPTSTPRSSKPVPTSTPKSSKPKLTSTPRSSKPVSNSAPRSSKTGSIATSGLHKPLSTSSPTFSKSLSTSAPRLSRPASASTSRLSKPISNPIARPVSQSSTRKPNSLIMEHMGDKDIVKRAFKSFQNNLNQLQQSPVDNPCDPRPISARESSEHELSSSVTSQKENERTRKATGKMNAQKIHVGTKWSTTSSRSLVETGERIYMKPDSSSPSPISEERAEKRKAFLKNLKEKSFAREEEKRRLSSKPKLTVLALTTNLG
ncbi:Formin-like protein 8 [Heracleum sosnowskyi]|uniref:Formin-like protein 8 n=1 Tax=Heracleum sosnowskyi TaxID=360622 RepID=A0AAD8MAN8_9APIA|nr:Formin-like protein 8 [Heracleum sosnowskyi]